MVVLLAVQPYAQTFIPNAIFLIGISNNPWYSQTYLLMGMPYLLIIASNGVRL